MSALGAGLVTAVVDQTTDFLVDTGGLRGSLKVQVDGEHTALVSAFRIQEPLTLPLPLWMGDQPPRLTR